MKRLAVAGACLSLLVAAGAAAQPKKPAAVAVKVENSSQWAIGELYISPIKQDEWGEDQLGEEVIEHGESFLLKNIPRGRYDVKIVDEDGEECVLREVEIAENDKVEITDENLLGCQIETEAEEEGEAEEQ